MIKNKSDIKSIKRKLDQIKALSDHAINDAKEKNTNELRRQIYRIECRCKDITDLYGVYEK